MKVSISKERLLQGLQHVLKAVSPNHHPIPVLSGVMLFARDSGLTVTSSNLSMSIQFEISADDISLYVHQTGCIVVNAHYLYEIIRRLAPGTVELEITMPMVLTIRSNRSLFRLSGLDAEYFPIFTMPRAKDYSALLQNRLLKSAIRQVAFAASTVETRPVLTGVSCELNDNSFRMTATDGVRLASRVFTMQNCNLNVLNIVIPRKNLLDLSKIITDDEDFTNMTIDGNQVHFSTNNLSVHSALIDGTYPTMKNIIPTSYTTIITLDTAEIYHALERACLLAGDHIVRLRSGPIRKLELWSRTAEIGDVIEEITAEEAVGDEVDISFNGRYMLDMFRNVDSTKVKVYFSGKWSPIVIQPVEMNDSATFVVTPVRTHNK